MLGHFFLVSTELAKAEFKLRNEGSYLGILWYLLNPLLLFSLLFLVFSPRLGGGIEQYPLYLLLGIIVFNFFTQTTVEAAKAVTENQGLIKSIKFPHEALAAAIVLKNLFSHLFEVIVFGVFMVLLNAPLINLVLYLPALLLLCVFVYGVSLVLAAITVYCIDLDNIWSFFSRLLWFATPIFYAIEGQRLLYTINLFNPMYHLITLARALVIYPGRIDYLTLGASVLFAALSLATGLLVFSSLKKKFAEMV